MIAIIIVCVMFIFVLWVSKGLETFIKAEETIKKDIWEEEKMLDTYSQEIPHNTSQGENDHE